jgi:cytochrome c-type biogenesis protein CcmE
MKKKTPIVAIGALAIAGSALGGIVLLSDEIGENLVYYWSPSEVRSNGEKAYGPTIRLGGVVRPGSIQWDPSKPRLAFDVADDHKPDARFLPVVSEDIPPQMFRDGIGVIVEGTYDRNGTFTSTRVMVNHSNEYRAPHPVDQPPGAPAPPMGTTASTRGP